MRNPFSRWNRLQRAAKPGRFYGDGGTIHSSTWVDVEVDRQGRVVAVWFRCQQVPFTDTLVDDTRAAEMDEAFARRTADGVHMPTGTHTHLTGITIEDGAARQQRWALDHIKNRYGNGGY